MAELRECDYCGGKGRGTVEYSRYFEHESPESARRTFVVVCSDCEAEGPHGDTKEAAVTAWNTRAYDAETERLQQALRREKVATLRQQERADAFEGALECGELLMVPCKRGDTIWAIFGFYSKAVKSSIVSHCKYNGADWIVETDGRSLTWGKRVFATRAEAEAALEKERAE